MSGTPEDLYLALYHQVSAREPALPQTSVAPAETDQPIGNAVGRIEVLNSRIMSIDKKEIIFNIRQVLPETRFHTAQEAFEKLGAARTTLKEATGEDPISEAVKKLEAPGKVASIFLEESNSSLIRWLKGSILHDFQNFQLKQDGETRITAEYFDGRPVPKSVLKKAEDIVRNPKARIYHQLRLK